MNSMSEAAVTIEGWYCLHDFRSIDWNSWRQTPAKVKKQALSELKQLLTKYPAVEAEKKGSTAVYSIVGQKADLVFMHLRETLHDIEALELELNKSAIAQFLIPAYSFVSIVELSNYMTPPGTDPMEVPEIAARLKPILPKSKHICFYPMDKRREGNDNWYSLDLETRKNLMKSHGMTGRKYAGLVRQIVTGSVGFDDWEWGVTLFADDSLQFKKIVYEMRFDEVSARYGEFGEFYVGNLFTVDHVERYFG
jgi:chlorite dismutase